MQSKNWNDLRYVLAVQREGTIAAAAGRLGVDATTVSRRMRVIEDALGGPLFERHGDAVIHLTTKGETVASHAAAVERHIALIDQDMIEDPHGLRGTVRLTSVPILVNRMLIPGTSRLFAANPDLQLDLIPDSRDFSLTRRVADLALRFARPKTSGTQITARRIANVPYGVYAGADIGVAKTSVLPWVGYDEATVHLPQARWMLAASRKDRVGVSALRVHDGESALEAILAGAGKTLIPTAIGDADERLVRVSPTDQPDLTRELWLLGHADDKALGRIKAVREWVESVFS